MSSVSTCSLSTGVASRRSVFGTGGRLTAACRTDALVQRSNADPANGRASLDATAALAPPRLPAPPPPPRTTRSLSPLLPPLRCCAPTATLTDAPTAPPAGDISCSCASVSPPVSAMPPPAPAPVAVIIPSEFDSLPLVEVGDPFDWSC
jgi:hypothetical protein